jgi:hypothetical protein
LSLLEKKYKADLSGWVFNIHIDGYPPVKTGEFFRTFAVIKRVLSR